MNPYESPDAASRPVANPTHDNGMPFARVRRWRSKGRAPVMPTPEQWAALDRLGESPMRQFARVALELRDQGLLDHEPRRRRHGGFDGQGVRQPDVFENVANYRRRELPYYVPASEQWERRQKEAAEEREALNLRVDRGEAAREYAACDDGAGMRYEFEWTGRGWELLTITRLK